jgi:hypothetical protein
VVFLRDGVVVDGTPPMDGADVLLSGLAGGRAGELDA